MCNYVDLTRIRLFITKLVLLSGGGGYASPIDRWGAMLVLLTGWGVKLNVRKINNWNGF